MYNDLVMFVNSAGNATGGNGNMYSHLNGIGNKSGITGNENGNGNYPI